MKPAFGSPSPSIRGPRARTVHDTYSWCGRSVRRTEASRPRSHSRNVGVEMIAAPGVRSSSTRNGAAVLRAETSAEVERLARAGGLVVVKCFARGCRSCLGIAPRFRKVAAAFSDRAAFAELDYDNEPEFCERLGVTHLPFFAFWSDGEYLGGEPIAWQRISALTERITGIIGEED